MSKQGGKSFACMQCKKRFFISGDLKKHMRIHREENPYACQQCQKSSTVADSLKKHTRTRSSDCLKAKPMFRLTEGQTNVPIALREEFLWVW